MRSHMYTVLHTPHGRQPTLLYSTNSTRTSSNSINNSNQCNLFFLFSNCILLCLSPHGVSYPLMCCPAPPPSHQPRLLLSLSSLIVWHSLNRLMQFLSSTFSLLICPPSTLDLSLPPPPLCYALPLT